MYVFAMYINFITGIHQQANIVSTNTHDILSNKETSNHENKVQLVTIREDIRSVNYLRASLFERSREKSINLGSLLTTKFSPGDSINARNLNELSKRNILRTFPYSMSNCLLK